MLKPLNDRFLSGSMDVSESPHSAMGFRMGLSDRPSSVNEYSTLGGTSGYTFRLAISSRSSSRSCWVSIFCEMAGIRFFIYPTRLSKGLTLSPMVVTWNRYAHRLLSHVHFFRMHLSGLFNMTKGAMCPRSPFEYRLRFRYRYR